MKIANKHKKAGEGKSFFVKQDFEPVDDRILDNKGRITISRDWIPYKNEKVRSFKIFRNGDGDLLLRPEISVPAREAWIYQNPEVIKSLKKGIKEIKQGKGEVVEDLDSYLEKL